jgi:hypothetical protein
LHARIDTPLSLQQRVICSKRDDGKVLYRYEFLAVHLASEFGFMVLGRLDVFLDNLDNFSGCLQSIHDRHVDIHEDDAVWAAAQAFLELFHCVLAVKSTIGFQVVVVL